MLSQKTIDLVKSTAPILNEHGERLTKHFYKRMFSHNPEVLPFFNPAHQTSGGQQRALAAAICAYAAHIDNLAVLADAVELIAQKHSSLMIQPEHYPIVGSNLLASIREVLGEGATDDIIDAWAQAYGVLADILINREKEIYEENVTEKKAWKGFKTFIVAQKETESQNITSFYLKPQDQAPLPTFLSGQYITLQMPMGTSTTMRNYSLSDKPGQDHLRISVKKESSLNENLPEGYVSNRLHNDINIGDKVEIGSPCGQFFLNSNENPQQPLILLAAGVGITPILSILLSALEENPTREITFIYACLNRTVQAFKDTIDALALKHPNFKAHYRYSALSLEEEKVNEANCSTGFISADLIESLIPTRQGDYYFCGPKPFMINTYQILTDWDIPSSQIHFEFFGPQEDLKEKRS